MFSRVLISDFIESLCFALTYSIKVTIFCLFTLFKELLLILKNPLINYCSCSGAISILATFMAFPIMTYECVYFSNLATSTRFWKYVVCISLVYYSYLPCILLLHSAIICASRDIISTYITIKFIIFDSLCRDFYINGSRLPLTGSQCTVKPWDEIEFIIGIT